MPGQVTAGVLLHSLPEAGSGSRPLDAEYAGMGIFRRQVHGAVPEVRLA